MRRTTQLFFGIFFAFFSFAFLSFSPVHAQSYSANTSTNTPQNLHTYTQNVFTEVIGGLGCLLGGIDVTDPQLPCSATASAPTAYNVKNSGLIGTFASLTGTLYIPPIHTSDYTRDLANHFGIIKHAYAATPTGGVGLTSLNPLIIIWKAFRNIAYLIFVVIFVLVGFGIMFRFNIDPRTVMSIENQLPKLIIGLILVTFSFAIAGLCIDIMWILTFFVINLLTGIDCQLVKCTADLTSTVTGNIFQNPFGFFNNVAPQGFLGVATGVGGSIGDVIRGLFTEGNAGQLGIIPPVKNNGDPNCTTFIICGIKDLVTNVVLNDLGSIIGAILSYIISALGILVVLIVLLIAMFRIWLSLIIAYGYIITNILLAPFFIVIGMIPGSKVNFTSWLRDILSNLLSFPTVIAILLLGRIVMDAFSTNSQALLVLPLIGNPNGASGADLSGVGVSPMGFIFGFFAMLAAPSAINIMRGIFHIEPGKLGGQIFGNLGMGGKAFGGFARNTFGALTGNDIRYKKDGSIETIEGPAKRALHRLTKQLGGG